MDIVMVILLLATFTLCRGVNVVTIKRAQTGSGNLFQHMLFIGIFAAIQGVLLFILPPYGKLEFSAERLLLPGLYGTFYVIYMIFTVLALREGPASLTTIISSFNPLFPVFVGMIFWNDQMTWIQGIGLALFCVSLLLFNSGDYSEAETKKPITLKWVIFALLALMFSGCSVTCTRRYCDTFDGYIKEYLIFYCLVTTLETLPFIIYGFLKQKDEMKMPLKNIGYTAITAVAIDVGNIIFMFYASAFSAAFYFPLTSVLGVVAVMLSSAIFLKERVSKKALVGIVTSTIALVLLAL